MSSQPRRQDQPVLVHEWVLVWTGAIGLYFLFTRYGPQLEGPAYLAYFAVVWLVLMILQAVLRLAWRDSNQLRGVASFLLIAVALTRYFWGAQHGMHNWGWLTAMTIVGCLLFFLSAADLRRDGEGDWSSGGGCSSGGCGGGCGGGGCGGCGG